MTTISSSAYSGQYYQLPTSNTSATGTATTQAAAAAAVTSATNTSLSAYMLDLSPDAQSYLSSYGSTDSSSTGLSGGTGSFVLSSAQQKEVNDIIAKYKDAPQTQDTFNQIQDDLKAAGLGPEQLSQIDKAKSFNSTTVLLNALNGNYSDPTAGAATTSDADEQTKSNNYVQSIIKQWQATSTVTPAADVTA